MKLAASRPATSAAPSVTEVADSARIRSQMEFLLLAIQEDIGLVRELGGIVKDVQAGLVDFLGRIEGEEVYYLLEKRRGKNQFLASALCRIYRTPDA